jgi:hypothetical protein
LSYFALLAKAVKSCEGHPLPLREPTKRPSGDPAPATWLELAQNHIANKQDFESNSVKTFSVFKPKSTIYTPNCGTWVNLLVAKSDLVRINRLKMAQYYYNMPTERGKYLHYFL